MDNCTKLIYVTNSNFWNLYYITDLKTRLRIKVGEFEPDGARLFGTFGCTTFMDYLITTGSSYAIKEQDFAHITVSKIKQDFSLERKVVKLCHLGNM